MTNHPNRSKKVEKVRNIHNGEVGYRACYGTAGFGGRRVVIMDTLAAANDVDVSNDFGRHVIVRGASGRDCYKGWVVTK